MERSELNEKVKNAIDDEENKRLQEIFKKIFEPIFIDPKKTQEYVIAAMRGDKKEVYKIMGVTVEEGDKIFAELLERPYILAGLYGKEKEEFVKSIQDIYRTHGFEAFLKEFVKPFMEQRK